MSTALKRVVLQRGATVSLAGKLPRRYASAEYAHMKAKKNNWVEQNEIARENTFYNWTVNKGNISGLLVMAVLFPAGYHYLNKNEQQIRDERVKGIKPREYY